MSALKSAIKQLHRHKDEAYRGAWKRRGELFSIIPNIARKVDRLAAFAVGAANIPSETILDTAIDLWVYSLKYTLYLADSDQLAAIHMKLSGRQPFSDNHENFDQLVEAATLIAQPAPDLDRQIRSITDSFERLWPLVEARASTTERFARAFALAIESEEIVASVAALYPAAIDTFVSSATIGPLEQHS